MKEFSIEEKAIAYDEAIEKARIWKDKSGMSKDKQGILDDIFPELKESEDERVRKALLEMVHDTTGDELWVDYNVHKEDALAWLEKQGEIIREWSEMKINNIQTELQEMVELKQKTEQDEQNPTDKIEPKFHEGDIIIHKELGGDYIHNSHKIIQVDILDKKYRLEGGLVAHFGEQDDYELVEQKPVWSEEDEKFVHGLIRGLTVKRDIHGHTTFSSDCIDITKTINWLKSLRPQK